MPEMGVGEFDTLIVNDGAGHFFRLARLTTTQRDALTAQEGMVISNSTTDTIQAYINSAWTNMDPRLLTFTTTAHTADADHRGMFYVTQGGDGVQDKLYCIMKGDDDGYDAILVAQGTVA